MKFLKYLNEKDLTIEEIKQILYKDCKPYLKQLTKINFKKRELLISGRKDQTPFGTKDIRKDRKPRDTKLEIHNWIDEQFYKKFGIKARSQTLFCTGDLSQASNFGYTHYIFPIGNFEVIWSNKHMDLYNKANMNMELKRYQEYFLKYVLPDYEKGGLQSALNSRNEIMLYCKSFRCYVMDTQYIGMDIEDFF